jgi:uncharacterized protein (UPF0147 family)
MVALESAIQVLSVIEQDNSVPKKVRTTIKEAITSLQEPDGKSHEVKIDQVLQQLGDLSDDPNLPPYTRTQIWNVVSVLESV